MNWINIPAEPEFINDYVGFVYEITEKDTGMKYIGIKKFWFTIRRKPLKGKKRVRIEKKESDWRTYVGSNTALQEKIKFRPYNYTKKILFCCLSVTEMKAREASIQLNYYFRGDWNLLYNEMINLRLRIRKNEKRREP